MPTLLLKQWVWTSKNCKQGVPTRPHKVYFPIIWNVGSTYACHADILSP